MWFPKDDLQDSASWSSSPLVLLRDIHQTLLSKYDYKDTAPPPPQFVTGTRVGRRQQDYDTQQQEDAPLFLPYLNKLHEASIVWGEDTSNVTTIPSQNRLTHQILIMCQHFKDLKQTFVVSLRVERFRFLVQHVLSLRLRTQFCTQS